MDRRSFIQKTAALGGLAAAERVVEILTARQAPAFAQGRKLHLLHAISFVPGSDAELRRQFAEYRQRTGVEVLFETINLNDLQARITAAVQSRNGADIIVMFHNWPHLYKNALADVSAVCEWKGADQGGYYGQSEAAARDQSRWLALPFDIIGLLIAYRRSWFSEIGVLSPPGTLDEYRRIGKALKQRGRPIGQTLGHTLGKAVGWAYPIFWAFGGAETDPSGRKVGLNSRETVESVKWMVAFWKEACDEGGLAWDETNSLSAFHGNEISAGLAGASLYIQAKRNPNILDEKGAPMFLDIGHFPIPSGPLPTPGYHIPASHAVMKYSQNQQAARELLMWLHSKEQYGKWIETRSAQSVGATTHWEQHPMWDRIDDSLKPFRIATRASRMFGYPGPPSAKAAEVFSKYIIVDMYAKAVQGLAPEQAVKWADGELKKIYEA